MNIKFFPPFDRMIGQKEVSITVEGKCTVIDLIDYLRSAYPQFKSFVGDMDSHDAVYWRLTIIREGIVLKPQDILKPDDYIYMITPIMGG
jgi:hypothetical protein